MKIIFHTGYPVLIINMLILSMFTLDCKRDSNPVKYPHGIFPSTVLNLHGLNSSFDDYNSTANQLTGGLPIIFSSNSKS
jgi:hypothetical protein